MSEIIVLGFKDPEEADRVLSKLHTLSREYLTDENAAVVGASRDRLCLDQARK